MPNPLAWLARLLRGRTLDRELDRELRAHLALIEGWSFKNTITRNISRLHVLQST